MERAEVESRLDRAERAVQEGAGLSGTGFWSAVGAVKQDPSLADTYRMRIAAIDRAAFEAWALFTVPAAVGTAVMVVGTLVGLGFVWAAYGASDLWAGLFLLAGTGITLVTTHGLAHLVVGRAFGMRFTHWFVGTLARPQPGVKVDYATYLATPARARAWMHASGALVTKAIPFLALGPALVIGVPGWVTALLVVIGVVVIVTDVLWSTNASDWKKFRREMSYAG
ncbi:MAG: hypothetical protein OEQ47_00490 [Acidimicrobiia bacterium]|nr:hypothetical protein [Acidimicrobiia bacterium]